MGTDARDLQEAMTQLSHEPMLILFSGLPGTLKTFVSNRMAQRLGCVWLPTVALGGIQHRESDELLSELRSVRYAHCVDALRALSQLAARVVVDGGFASAEHKRFVFSTYAKCPRLLVHCEADEQSRQARLRMRAGSAFDVERESAEAILAADTLSPAMGTGAASPETPALLGCDAIVHLNTTSFEWRLEGRLDDTLRQRLAVAIRYAFDEFRATDKYAERESLKGHFAALAPCYDETTEWRADPALLAQLRVELKQHPSDILDVGSGTGLAAEWYAGQGHRCVGIDLSPQMSVRAAPRLLFTTFGSAMDLPFFDASFDLALMRQVLHYTEPALALQEVFRVVRPGGGLVLAAAVAPGAELRPVWEEFKSVTQPLRLRVFTQADLIGLVEGTGFTLHEIRLGSVLRCESFEQLEKRATAPGSGWPAFLGAMEKIFAGVGPQLEFKVSTGGFSYRQFWVTLVADRPAPAG